MIPCPRYLVGEARRTFRAIAIEMQAAGTLGTENARTIERYATTYARWREAEAKVAELGMLTAAPKTGTPMYSLWLAIAHQEADRLARLEADLGLTPASRNRLGRTPNHPGTPNKQDPWEQMRMLQSGEWDKLC